MSAENAVHAHGQGATAGAQSTPETPTPRPQTGEGVADATVERERLRQKLALNVYTLFRNLRLYHVNNAVLRPAIEGFSSLLRDLIARDAVITISFIGPDVFFNRSRLRLNVDEVERIAWLRAELERIGVGGFRFKVPLGPDETSAFFDLLAKWGFDAEGVEAAAASVEGNASGAEVAAKLEAAAPDHAHHAPEKGAQGSLVDTRGKHRDADTIRLEIEKKLRELFGEGVSVQRIQDPEDKRTVREDLELRLLACVSFARLRVYARLAFANADRTLRMRRLYKLVRKSVQDIALICVKDTSVVLPLASIKDGDDYSARHAATTAILACAIGARLGMSRAMICEVGMSGFFADLGMARVAANIAHKGPLQDAERADVERHPERSVAALFDSGLVYEATVRQALVAFEHHLGVDGKGYPHSTYATLPELLARIVAIADAYDAMTSERPHRLALLPDEALRAIMSGAGTRYDAALVKLFVNTVGLFPVGSVVRLSSGELAIVAENHRDPMYLHRPKVQIVATRDDGVLDTPRLVDLSKRTVNGVTLSIEGTVAASKLPFTPASVLMTDTPPPTFSATTATTTN